MKGHIQLFHVLVKMALALAVCFLFAGPGVANADTYVPSRTLNLVYDDSGSMIRQDGKAVDTWCQAKYALEVVAAMLGERDTLNVYYMSDYGRGKSGAPRLMLKGSRSPAQVSANVAKVHGTVTRAGNTPFHAVEVAYEDLKRATTDERWLIVLTDGEFEDGKLTSEQVLQFYEKAVSDGRTKVMMLAMGAKAAMVQSNPEKGIYFEHADSTRAILPKLTEICNRIFQRNTLKASESGVLSFGVPMAQLIVFAQGRDVEISDIEGNALGKVKPDSNVHTQYSTEASVPNPTNLAIANDLNGYVATFDRAFAPGTYHLNVHNSESIEVYYKPNVKIAMSVYDMQGNDVTNMMLETGKYRIDFGFADAETGEKVKDTSLLGNIEYKATAIHTDNNGQVTERSFISGETVELKEGRFDVDVTARYLEYNTLHALLSYNTIFKATLDWQVQEKPDFILASDGISPNGASMKLLVSLADKEQVLTQELWDEMPLPTVQTADGSAFNEIVSYEVHKGQLGEYEIIPKFVIDNPMEAPIGMLDFKVSIQYHEKDKKYITGKYDAQLMIKDGIGGFERFLDWLSRHVAHIIGGFLFLVVLLGYVIKKKLPKRLKERPKVEKTQGFKLIDDDLRAKVEKDRLSFLLPYVPQKCVFSLQSKKLYLKAIGGGRMEITNLRAYVHDPETRDKTGVQFDGDFFEEDEIRPGTLKKISAATTIAVIEEENGKLFTYTCVLNT